MTVTVQVCRGWRVAPQVVVERKGGSVVRRRRVMGWDWVRPGVLVRVRVLERPWPERTWPKSRMPVPGARGPERVRVERSPGVPKAWR